MMLAVDWIRGVVSRRAGRLLGVAAAIALTVALLASVGSFISSGTASMTRRARAEVPVDWQVLVVAGAQPETVQAALTEIDAPRAVETVAYADVDGFTANTGGTVQTTGAGKVLGITATYRQEFAAELRSLVGSAAGIVLAQQTSANLHAGVGDTITILRRGLPPADVTVAGIVELPYADSLFQAVGVPPSAAPQAPPDNVLVLPIELWRQLFGEQATVHPESVRTQLHVRLGATLPGDPALACTMVQELANNLEARMAGGILIGNNLAARLSAAKEDALYARVLFLFLGFPGVVLAMLLTATIAASGAERRRTEQALLRMHGASVAQVLRLTAVEAALAGILGSGVGLGLAGLAGPLIGFDAENKGVGFVWLAGAAILGLTLAIAVVTLPAWSRARHATVMAGRASIGRTERPRWQRFYLDFLLLAVSAMVFRLTASTGYQVVLAPEGTAAVAVHYETFIAPLCLWIGAVLLALRGLTAALSRGRRVVARLLVPVAGALSGLVAASLARQRAIVGRGMALVALAASFAVSTAIFNATYNAQSHIDAELTNGADVTISGPSATALGGRLAQLRQIPGVAAAAPMQHRFAYVGSDLQDLYGIDPAHIGQATAMSGAYFAGGNAGATLTALASRPDGVLVAEETVQDYRLTPGDHINLRLEDAGDHQYHVIPFRFVAVVREFPTAPRDSFLVANAGYVARMTHSEAAEVILLRAAGDPAALAERVRPIVADLAGVRVTDVGSVERAIGSSLTAIDLRGLTRIELFFAIILVAFATGLTLALGITERRRTFEILGALGAKRSQVRAFYVSEALVIFIGGSATGIVLGVSVAQMLVKLLTGVFDPPPESLAIPWGYFAVLAAAALASTIAALWGLGLKATRQNLP